jgi:hypothetical protein
MGNYQDRDFLINRLDSQHHSCFRRRVQGASRFLEDKHIGFSVSRPSYCYVLSLAT